MGRPPAHHCAMPGNWLRAPHPPCHEPALECQHVARVAHQLITAQRLVLINPQLVLLGPCAHKDIITQLSAILCGDMRARLCRRACLTYAVHVKYCDSQQRVCACLVGEAQQPCISRINHANNFLCQNAGAQSGSHSMLGGKLVPAKSSQFLKLPNSNPS